MLYLEVILIALVTLAACFFFGKKLGERKFLRVSEEMKALELSFNQLLEQMEVVSSHNLKVLETKTEELRLLLPIVDKKLLHAQDLSQHLEEQLSRKTVEPTPAEVGPSRDLKYRRDVQEAIAGVQNRIGAVEQRLQEVENRPVVLSRVQEPQSWEPRQAPQRIVPVSDKIVDFKPRETRKESTVGSTSEMAPALAAIVRQAERQLQEIQKPGVAKVAVAGQTRRLETSAEEEASSLPDALPEELGAGDVPAPGTLFYDVLSLSQQGVTIPQIARKMNIGNGEVELIMKLYGSRFNLRKVM